MVPTAPVRAQVVKLDRGFPLVRLADGTEIRSEHATDVVKTSGMRCCIGDYVELSFGDFDGETASRADDATVGGAARAAGAAVGAVAAGTHDKAIVTKILPRTTEFTRKDPTERAVAQILAANFNLVIIAEPIVDLNIRRLERELVLAHETGAEVAIVLTKADLAKDDALVADTLARVEKIAGTDVAVLALSQNDPALIGAVRALIGADTTAILIGKSGVGKSSLVNLIAGDVVAETGEVRTGDGKGRHTTVSREMIDLPGGGRIVDMPGVRGLGMWESDGGIGTAFRDIEQLALSCRFGDCKHDSEPGCAVRAAVETGELSQERLDSYRVLKSETQATRNRKRQATWKNK